MKLLIVAATLEEIRPSIPLLEQKQIQYVITGVGMTATAFALGKIFATQKFDCVLNIGIGGSLDKKIVLGQVVQIYKDSFSELGAEDDQQFIRIDELGFGQSTYTARLSDYNLENIPSYEGITVNAVHGNENSIQSVKSLFPTAAIESMEGAAVFYACAQENTVAVQVRGISNYVEKRDRSTWNIPLAIKNSNIWLANFIQKNY